MLLPGNHVLTCAHVLPASTGPIAVRFADGSRGTAHVVALHPPKQDETGDIAILELDGEPPDAVRPAELEVLRGRRGRVVRAFGHPKNIAGGAPVSAVLTGRAGPRGEWIQLEGRSATGLRIEPGFSGAGVADDDTGKVLGIIVAAYTVETAKTAWMLPLDVVAGYWPKLHEYLPDRRRLDPSFGRHFEPRARGVRHWTVPGWFFTGRRRAMVELTAWLNSPDDTRARVVTGSPGCGKSAVLGRLVTLSDPEYRRLLPEPVVDEALSSETLPDARSIDVAINAHGKTTGEIRQWISGEIGAPSRSDVDLLAEELLSRAVVVVVDGLDEAKDPRRLIRELLSPLIRSGVRLLIGSRREQLELLGASVVVLDLDDLGSYREPADVADYVTALLVESGPYRNDRPAAAVVAERVGHRAGTSFLVAQLTALDIAQRRAPVEVTAFPSTVADAMSGYLESTGDNLHERGLLPAAQYSSARSCSRWIRDLVTPLAFAEGDGLDDDDAWAAIATRLGTAQYTRWDVRLLRQDTPVRFLLTSSPERKAWRVFHEALAGYLRDSYRGDTAPHEVFTEVLLPPAHDWSQAGGYARRHLPRHAAAANRLDDLVADVAFLLIADSGRLVPLLHHTTGEAAAEAARVYRRAAHLMAGTRDTASVQALAVTARLHGAEWMADELLAFDRRWDVAWSHWRSLFPRRIFCHQGAIRSLAAREIDGDPVIISGDEHGLVRLSDPTTGRTLQHYTPFSLADIGDRNFRKFGPAAEALAVESGHVGATTVIAVGHESGLLRIWEQSSGSILGALGCPACIVHLKFVRVAVDQDELSRWRTDGIDEAEEEPWQVELKPERLARVDFGNRTGQPAVVLYDDHGFTSLALLTEEDPVLVARASTGPRSGTGPLETSQRATFTSVNGVPLLVVAAESDRVDIWNLHSRQVLGRLQHPGHGAIRAVTCTIVDEELVIVTADDAGAILVWDATDGTVTTKLSEVGHGIHALSCTEIAGVPVVTASFFTGAVQIWDMRTGEPISVREPGHDRGIPALQYHRFDGREYLVSGGTDSAIGIWDARELCRQEARPSPSTPGPVTTVAVRRFRRQPVAIAGSPTRVTAWKTTTGEYVHDLPVDNASQVVITALRGKAVVVLATADHSVEVRRLDTGKQLAALHEMPESIAEIRCISDRRRLDVITCGWRRISFWAVRESKLPITKHYPPTPQTATIPIVAAHERIEAGYRFLFTILGDQLYFWDTQTGKSSAVAPIGMNPDFSRAHITCLDYYIGPLAPDITFAVGFDDGTVLRRTFGRDGISGEHSVVTHSSEVRVVKIVTIGGALAVASGSSDGSLRVRPLSAEREWTIELGSAINAITVTYHPLRLIVGTNAGVACLRYLDEDTAPAF